MAVLDAFGRPIKTKTLTKKVAEPGITSVRQAWAQSVASGLTPSKLASILASSAQGNVASYLALAEEMEERDQHYASVLGVRKRAVSGVEPIVTPASDDARDVEIADAVRLEIAEHDGFTDLVEDLLDALGKGFSVVELMWARSADRWTFKEFVHRDPRFFQFDLETGREIRLVDEADMVNGIELEPARFARHVPRLKSGLPIRGGLARLSAFAWMCKAYTMKDWIAFIECYGLPLRLGRYGGSATAEDVEKLYTAVANIGTDAAAVLPENMRIEFQEVSAGTGNDVFEKFARWADEQTSKGVLGQTMTSDNGSSMAQAEVHNDVRHDIAASDARAVNATIARDIIRPFVDLNFGVQSAYPRLKIVIEEAEDLDLIMKHTDRMIARGLKVRASEVRGKLGWSEPDADDEVLGAAPKGKVVTQQARNRAGDNAHPYDALDALLDAHLEDWDAVMDGTIGPLLEALEDASGYDEAMALVEDLFPKLDDRALTEKLVTMFFQSRAEGDAGDV